ncbi:MAG: VOC family protein [Pseudomonadota bacterium]
MLVLDHLAVSCRALAEGTQALEGALDVPFQPGGKHPHFGTHNQLLGLGPEYLEVIAIDPAAAPLGNARWFDLDRFAGPPRLTNWIVRVAALEEALAALGPEYGTPVSLARGDLRWRMAVPASGVLPYDNCAPAIIEWETPPPLSALKDHGHRLAALTVTHPRAEALAAQLAPYLGDDRIGFEPGPAALSARFERAGTGYALT